MNQMRYVAVALKVKGEWNSNSAPVTAELSARKEEEEDGKCVH